MNRLVFAGIAVFWLIMSTLLVRMQLQPETSALREVPPARVLAVLFEHQQSSTLGLRHQRLHYGTVSVHPSIGSHQERVLKFGGSTLLRASYLPHDRLSLEGEMKFDPALALIEARGSFELRDQATRFSYRFDSSAQSFVYSIERNGTVFRKGDISLQKGALARLATDVGIDPAMLDTISSSGDSVTLSAHYSTFRYRDEKVEAYSLVLQRDHTTLSEIFISQLGQILMVKTPFGVELLPTDLMP